VNRQRLIDYSYFFKGEYNKIINAIRNNIDVPRAPDLKCITIFDNEYPKILFNLKCPPLVLYYEGNLELLKKDAIGIVGSRIPCEYASNMTALLSSHYKDKVIVSGLAKGIDAIAHKNAKLTIGVLGCGINYYYPYENKKLIDDMKSSQLVISEYPDKTIPYAHHFPFRNRIIACLANELYVMQTSEKSGTLSTVNEALELGRQIKVLPFGIDEKLGKYNNYLINEGAQIIDYDEIYD